MSDASNTHSIEDHLRDDWVVGWIEEGLDAVEAFLRNHASFDRFLEGRENDGIAQ